MPAFSCFETEGDGKGVVNAGDSREQKRTDRNKRNKQEHRTKELGNSLVCQFLGGAYVECVEINRSPVVLHVAVGKPIFPVH